MLLLFLFLPCLCWATPFAKEDSFRALFDVQPPHCSRTSTTLAHISRNSRFGDKRDVEMQFQIGLHTSVCFRTEDDGTENSKGASSWLHTIRLLKLEHHHPVTQAYVFAIPEVKADCFCECDSSAISCSTATHRYKQCPEGDAYKDDKQTSCYRTFFPNQAPNGCDARDKPNLCCDVKFRPYKNQSYTAVKIEQPSTYAVFVYTAYDFSHGRWIIKDQTKITTQLDGGTQDNYLDSAHRMYLSVAAGGRASHQLESGMYFTNYNPGGEMDSLKQHPLNELYENNFDRLGWYRMNETTGQYHVNNGAVRIEDIHKAEVVNCKTQTFKSLITANNYMPGHMLNSRPLDKIHSWIQNARLYDGNNRQVVVSHAEGVNLQITLRVNGAAAGNDHKLVFFHNVSRVDDFTGTIIVDSRSNRYFNLTVYGASGKINGIVKYSTNKESDQIHSFTTFVSDHTASNRSMIIPLPAVVESGARMICLRADEQQEDTSICRIVEYHESPLEINIDENTWHDLEGHCATCNQINLGGLVRYLNPMSWAKGVTSLGDFVMMATDVFIYVSILFVIYIVLTKIVIPIMKCWICPLYILSRKEKKKKKNKRKQNIEDGSMV